MWLDELADLVRKLRERIEEQGDILRKNESATRYALVDPLLRALGWDLENPSEVVPEYSPGKGYADYGMMVGRAKPRLIVEAKSLGTPVRQGVDQAVGYCVSQGIEYFAVTNGEMWEIYEPFRPVPIDEKLITSFDLRGPEHDTVLKMLWLWRGNFVTGKPVLPAEGPVPQPAVAPPKAQPGPPSGDWVPFETFQPQLGTRPPGAIRFPDGGQRPITRWYELQVRVVEWLVQTGKLSRQSCPVMTDRGTHIVHTQPTRKTGTRFINPRQVGDLWIEVSYAAPDHARLAADILRARDVDPATVYVLPAN